MKMSDSEEKRPLTHKEPKQQDEVSLKLPGGVEFQMKVKELKVVTICCLGSILCAGLAIWKGSSKEILILMILPLLLWKKD